VCTEVVPYEKLEEHGFWEHFRERGVDYSRYEDGVGRRGEVEVEGRRDQEEYVGAGNRRNDKREEMVEEEKKQPEPSVYVARIRGIKVNKTEESKSPSLSNPDTNGAQLNPRKNIRPSLLG
jgi:hypothetical protein